MNKLFLYKEEQIHRPFGETFFIIKPGAIGDVLHMTPVVRAIKQNRPGSKVLFLVGSKAALEILYHNPYVDDVIMFQKGRGVGELSRVMKLAKSPQFKGVDWVLNYQPSNWRWRLLTVLLKPKGILTYKKQKRVRAGEKRLHAVQDHLAPLTALEIKEESLEPDFFLTDQEIEEAMKLIGYYQEEIGAKGIIGLNIGASHPVNRWPVTAFHRLNTIVTSSGFMTILIGGPEDRMLAEHFFGLGPSHCLDLVGHTSIRQTAAVITQCDLLVSADTGPLHLATSVGTRVIGLFGASDPERTGPIGPENRVIQSDLPCVPCRKRRCKLGTRACMEAITPDEVAAKIIEMVSSKSLED